MASLLFAAAAVVTVCFASLASQAYLAVARQHTPWCQGYGHGQVGRALSPTAQACAETMGPMGSRQPRQLCFAPCVIAARPHESRVWPVWPRYMCHCSLLTRRCVHRAALRAHRTFQAYNPLIESIDVLEFARRRRAKLYYLKERNQKVRRRPLVQQLCHTWGMLSCIVHAPGACGAVLCTCV